MAFYVSASLVGIALGNRIRQSAPPGITLREFNGDLEKWQPCHATRADRRETMKTVEQLKR